MYFNLPCAVTNNIRNENNGVLRNVHIFLIFDIYKSSHIPITYYTVIMKSISLIIDELERK